MDKEELRARGISTTLRGQITNPLRRLLWPLNAPYYAGMLEEIAELRRRMEEIPHAMEELRRASARSETKGSGDPAATRQAGALEASMLRHYDALKKDVTAVAHRLASLEEQSSAGTVIGAGAPAATEPPRPTYAQCGEDRIVDYLLRACGGPQHIRYLDIGAALPSGDNNTFLFYQYGGSGVLIEADPGYRAAYSTVRPRDIAESVALMPAAMLPGSGTTELLVGENPGWTTILPERAAEALHRGKGHVRQRITVPVTTIGDVPDRHFADGELHLISVDAEGLDDALIREIDFDRHKPWVIVIEVMGAEGPAEFLAERGYAAYASTYVNRIFVREDMLSRAVF